MPQKDLFAIWGRIVQSSWSGLSAEEARAVLKLQYKKQDLQRIEKLSRLAQAGTISPREKTELEGFLYMGRLLAIMHSNARRSLKATKASPPVRRKAS